jgi:hypothetical protein
MFGINSLDWKPGYWVVELVLVCTVFRGPLAALPNNFCVLTWIRSDTTHEKPVPDKNKCSEKDNWNYRFFESGKAFFYSFCVKDWDRKRGSQKEAEPRKEGFPSAFEKYVS